MTFFAKALKSLDLHRGIENMWHKVENKTPAPILQIQDLNFSYGPTKILKDVCLEINCGDCLAVIGPNGGGKTTLLKLIAGLLKPDHGSIHVCGQSAHPARGVIGYVPQESGIAQGFPITAIETILTGAIRPSWFQQKPSQAEIEFAEAIMERLSLKDACHKSMDQLSGGQRQRVLIARALMSSPSLLLFDEPTSNVDPEGRYCFHELMAELSGTVSMVVVSHDLSILSSGVTGIAGVNRTLAFTQGISPTPEILELIYGQHSADCPMGDYLRELQTRHTPHEHSDACNIKGHKHA